MASFHIPQLKASLPILEKCYGFDIYEMAEVMYALGCNTATTKKDMMRNWQADSPMKKVILMQFLML